MKHNREFYPNVTSVSGGALLPDELAYPCGTVAKYYFRDTVTVKDSAGADLSYDTVKSIAWESDSPKYKNSPVYLTLQNLDLDDSNNPLNLYRTSVGVVLT
jgi:hypothetical protein